MNNCCNDNRFELIKKYKDRLIESTNIADSHVEMATIDDTLFRFWQMGWLVILEQPELVRCKDCKQYRRWINTDICFCDRNESNMMPDDFCSLAERKEHERTD